MSDILADIDDLIHQATTERSHNYTADVLKRARAEIIKTRRERDSYLRTVGDIASLVPIPEIIKATGTTADLVAWLKDRVALAEQRRDGERQQESVMDWQPIETAPKDKNVLVYNPMVGVYLSRFNPTNYGGADWPCYFWGGHSGKWYPVPTHWMPVPEAPRTDTAQKQPNAAETNVNETATDGA